MMSGTSWTKTHLMISEFHSSNGTLPLLSTQVTSEVKQSAVMDFKLGIKHDLSQYPTLNDEKYFDQFQMAMVAQARAHDNEEVIDPDCKPGSADGKALSLEKQKFAFAVLMKCVQTDTSKTFLHLHQDTSDAQLVWKKLMEHSTKSPSVELAIVELQHLLAKSKIGSGWHGSAQGFLLYWNDNVRKLEELLLVNQCYSPDLKKLMLKASVQSLECLANAAAIDFNHVAKGDPSLDYHTYFDLREVSFLSRRTIACSTPSTAWTWTIRIISP